MSTYLHKYSHGYAGLVYPLTQLLRKDVEWNWTQVHNDAFRAVKSSLTKAPILILPDHAKPFHVVCDASNFAIGGALMQFDAEGKERVVSYQSRQLKPAEKNYPVHDRELLANEILLDEVQNPLVGPKARGILHGSCVVAHSA